MPMSPNTYHWKVTVIYPRQLIELSQQSRADVADCLLVLVKAAEQRGGRPDCTMGRHTDRRADSIVERYEFAEALKAGTFVEEATRILDNCDSDQLQRAVARQRSAFRGEQYQIYVQSQFTGEIGKNYQLPS
jgi:hypothetical protein